MTSVAMKIATFVLLLWQVSGRVCQSSIFAAESLGLIAKDAGQHDGVEGILKPDGGLNLHYQNEGKILLTT
jgi:hypothetical protein